MFIICLLIFIILSKNLYTFCYRQRDKLHVKALRVWSSDKPHPQEEVCFCNNLFSVFIKISIVHNVAMNITDPKL